MKIDNNKKGIIFGLLILITMLTCMFLPTWLEDFAYVYGGDLKPQHFQFFTEFRSLMRNFIYNHELPFYSWDIFLGNNFYSSKAYYLMGDIYAYLSLLIDAEFYEIFVIQTYLKLSVAYISFYALARTYKYSYKVSIVLSLSYAMSSWVIFFIGQPMFVSFYSFMPLYFLGMELYIRKENLWFFILASTLCLFTNYYLFFAVSMFSPIYFLSRYYILNGSFDNVVGSTVKLIVLYLLGAAITGVLTIPAALYIAGNDRVGEFSFLLLFDDIKIYLHQLQAMFVPSQLLIYRPYNVFETGFHLTREICMWAGSLTALLVPQLLSDEDNTYRKTMRIVYIIFIILMIVPMGSMAMLGFSSYSLRWVVLIIFTNLLVSGRYMDNFDLINYRNLKNTVLVFIAVLFLNYPVTLILTGEMNLFTDNIISYLISLVFMIYFIFIAVVIFRRKTRAVNLLLAVTVIELFIVNFMVIGIFRLPYNTSWDYVERVTHTLQEEDNGLNNYLNGLDPENPSQYYRVYIPRNELYWAYSHNQSVFYQLNGIITYDSTYAPSFIEMKNIAPQVKDFHSEWIFTIEDPDLIDFVNVKYAIVTDPQQLPEGNYKLIADDYMYSLLVYENMDYRSIGMTYNSIIRTSEIKTDGSEVSKLLDNIIVKDEDYEAIKSMMGSEIVELENITYGGNHFYGSVESSESTFMVLTLPYNPGWTVSVNGEIKETYSVNGGMMGFEINEGYNEVYLNFIPYGFKTGLVVSVIGFALSVLVVILNLRANKGAA